jgi:hypothetical protein
VCASASTLGWCLPGKSRTLLSPHRPLFAPSSSIPQHKISTTIAFTNNYLFSEIFLAKFAGNTNEFDTQTRALAQDDNSEPRRSPIQVLTAQRFSPKSSCFDLRVSLHLTATTSCVARIMCFFPTVCLLSVPPPKQPTMDIQWMPQDAFHRIYPPR